MEAFTQDVSQEWPIPIDTLDSAIDIFCYKHLANKQDQANYRQQLHRTLKQTGYYFISLASEQDGFYGPLLDHSPQPETKLVIDPYSKIPSFLYSMNELIAEFADTFEVVETYEQTSVSPMYGQEYPRVVLNCIFRKIDLIPPLSL